MKPVLLLLLAAVGATAQLNVKTASTAKLAEEKPAESARIGPREFAPVESFFNGRIASLDSAIPFDLLGGARGVYVGNYGAVITAEVSLVVSPPGLSPFGGKITPARIEEVHKNKLAHLPQLRLVMRETLQSAAQTLKSLPSGEKIFFAVRLLYQPYENTSGLPAQIVMTADRASALGGNVQMEEQ